MLGELPIAELDAGLFIRPLGMRLGKGHRHVDVRAASFESGGEDRWVEPWIRRVDNHVGSGLPCRRDDRLRIGGVELEGREAIWILESRNGAPGTVAVAIRESHVVEEGPSLRDRRDGGSDAPRTDHQHVHSGEDPTIRR